MRTIKATLVAYDLDARSPEWTELSARIAATGARLFHVFGDGKPSPFSVERDKEARFTVELETACLFDDQWNTGPMSTPTGESNGHRVFDWYRDHAWTERGRAVGHYLELPESAHAARRDTLKCAYCGVYYGAIHPDHRAIPADGMCNACLGSEYLKRADWPLLRLRSVGSMWAKREPLTEAETETLAAVIGPAFKAAQKALRVRQVAKARAAIERKRGQQETERAGMLWLLDHGFLPECAIYYSHRGVFVFDWREKMDAHERSALLDVVSEFPYEYEFKGGNAAAREPVTP